MILKRWNVERQATTEAEINRLRVEGFEPVQDEPVQDEPVQEKKPAKKAAAKKGKEDDGADK